MQITLTQRQWGQLKRLVSLGAHAERRMGPPIEITNGSTTIDMEDGEIKIVLTDEE